MKHTLLTCWLLLTGLLAAAQTLPPEWTHHNATADGSGTYTIPMVIADPTGQIIVCGETYSPGPLIGFITTKYDTSGNILWESKYDTPGQDEIKTAATDSAGNIYVAGSSSIPFTGVTEGLLFKYAAVTGDTLWSYRYPQQTPSLYTSFASVLVAPDQRVWLMGGATISGVWENFTFVVVLDADGQEIKRTELQGGLGFALTAHGDRYTVWGRKDQNFICWQLDTAGNLLEQHSTPAYTDPSGGEVHVDMRGNLYVGDLFGEHKATKYDPMGNWLWTYAKPFVPHPNPGYVTARGEGLNTDAEGNLYFSGMYYDGTQRRHYFTALDSAGQLIWEQQLILEGAYFGAGFARSIVADEKYICIGTYALDSIGLKSPLYVGIFEKSGHLFSALLGAPEQKYSSKSLVLSENYLYACGISWNSPNPSVQFLGKYAVPFIYSSAGEKRGVKIQGLYPNPVGSVCVINLYNPYPEEQGVVDLLDSQGKILRSEPIRLLQGEQPFVLDGLEILPPGIYWIRVHTPGAVFSGKLLKG